MLAVSACPGRVDKIARDDVPATTFHCAATDKESAVTMLQIIARKNAPLAHLNEGKREKERVRCNRLHNYTLR